MLGQYQAPEDDSEESKREMNSYELDLLDQFERNDGEIDEVLGQIIDAAQNVKLVAQDIGQEIETQQQLLKKLNSKVEKSRRNLAKKDNDI